MVISRSAGDVFARFQFSFYIGSYRYRYIDFFPFSCAFLYLGFVYVDIFLLHLQSHLVCCNLTWYCSSFEIICEKLNVWDKIGLFGAQSKVLKCARR